VKVPFIQTVFTFDKRWLEWSGDPNQIPTKDKKYILGGYLHRWRIQEPAAVLPARHRRAQAPSPGSMTSSTGKPAT